MSQPVNDRLYDLLPALYRLRDAPAGQPLRALLALLADELDRVEEDVTGLYENWFIETCQDWVVPYIGDLLGVRGIAGAGAGSERLRAFVGNTLSFRRRKGTLGMLADLTQALTGWSARPVEFFPLVAATQHLRRPRPAVVRTPLLRDPRVGARLGGPFDQVPRLLDVRRRGRYALQNLGIFAYRLQPFPVRGAAPAPGPAPGQYFFHPAGVDTPLFNLGSGRSGESEADFPDRLQPATLRAELAALAAARQGRPGLDPVFFTKEDPAFQIADDAGVISPAEIEIADLPDPPPPAAPSWPRPASGARVAVDPLRGRLSFAGDPARVRVSFQYGFSAELGGGPYDRPVDGAAADPLARRRQLQGGGALDVRALAGPGPLVLEIADSLRYELAELLVPENTALTIRAADRQWPVLASQGGRLRLRLSAGASVTFDGLLFPGGIDLLPEQGAADASVTFSHCTLVPDPADPSLSVQGMVPALRLHRCITGRLELFVSSDTVGSPLLLSDTIIDGNLTATAADACLSGCTILGLSALRSLPRGSDVLFADILRVARPQGGCLRFSYVPTLRGVPLRTELPPLFQCPRGAPLDGVAFTSRRYGQPGYCQLGALSPAVLRSGGSEQGEIGAFHHLNQSQREANLRAALADSVRFGRAFEIFYQT